MDTPVDDLADQARSIVERERRLTASRLVEVDAAIGDLERLMGALRTERTHLVGRLADAEESLGIAVQMPLPLRGRRLREVAVQLLRERVPIGQPIHYRDWLDLLSEAGMHVGGADPGATLLTQIARCEQVESVRPRSGLFRLRDADPKVSARP